MCSSIWFLHWLVLLLRLAPFGLSGGLTMTEFPEDLQLHSNGDVFPQHVADGAGSQLYVCIDETLQQHFTDDGDTVDIFGGPGFDLNHDIPDDVSLLSGDPAPCRLDDFAEEPHRVQSSAVLQPGMHDTSPTLAREQHDAIFARSLLSNCDFSGLKMPWEVGIFKDIFSDEPVPQPLVPAMEISADCSFGLGVEPQAVAEKVAEAASTTTADPIFATCVSCANGKLYAERRASLRDAAISKLLVVLKHCLSASVTGRHILALGDEASQSEGARGIIDAVVGVRSPATLVKRANSLLTFLRWVAHSCEDCIDPFCENVLWRFLTFLRDTGAPATRADSTLSAMRFAHFVLGFDGLASAVTSRRLVGISEIMLAGKRLLRQASVLTVAQVLGLHASLTNKNLHIMDRAVIGYILFSLYGRCRNSDFQSIHSIETDFGPSGGFVIIETCNHKAGRLAALKTRLLPILIPARGVNGEVWIADAMQVFSEAGVNLDNPIDGPLLPAPAGESGAFLGRSLMSSEVSAMLRSFLGVPNNGHDDNAPLFSSHSLKATTLAWAARYGLSPATRSLLGRHTSCLNETFSVYSRDLMVSPVVELQRVIDEIANGNFSPDEQRSRFFGAVGADGNMAGPNTADGDECIDVESIKSQQYSEVTPEVPDGEPTNAGDAQRAAGDEHDVDSDDSSSDDEGQLSSEDSDAPDLPPPRVKRFRARIPVEEKWFVHAKSRLVHRFENDCHEGIRILVCGKRLTHAYEPCTEATAWNVLCKSCNRR